MIVRISREEHMTVIIVEHNIKEIIDEVDWVIGLDRRGTKIADCPKDEAGDIFRREVPAEYADACRGRQDPKACGEQEGSSEVILDISHLSFAYPVPGKKREKGKQILDDFHMQVHKQDFLAIVGENGVGKSTLMKLIFKVCRPDSGSVRLYGKDLRDYHTKRLYHMIGLVFQNPENQFIRNTVWDEMMFSLKRTGGSHEEKEARVWEMLKRFHLEEEKDKSPFVLSQGQKRRLSVASMLLTNQEILFLDEPTYGQDFENRQELMKEMQKLVESGITIVMITHDLSLVRQYATRVIEIENGRAAKSLLTEEYFARKG
jgi:energy-coupling factor transport system ATP-binding protein